MFDKFSVVNIYAIYSSANHANTFGGPSRTFSKRKLKKIYKFVFEQKKKKKRTKAYRRRVTIFFGFRSARVAFVRERKIIIHFHRVSKRKLQRRLTRRTALRVSDRAAVSDFSREMGGGG